MAESALDRNLTDSKSAPAALRPPSASVLDRPFIGNLSVERAIYITVFAIAVLTRFYIVGVRPFHHDESIHAFFSWKITQDGVADYQYDPVYHGPVLYYWTALVLRLFGDSDFTARVSPVLFGMALLGFAWPLRRYLGRWGALAYLILFTFSPSLTYFTRFLRHDIYLALFNVAAIYCVFRYGETRQPRFLYGASASLALAFCTKEDMYALGPVFIASLVIMLAWEVVYASDWRPTLRAVRAETPSPSSPSPARKNRSIARASMKSGDWRGPATARSSASTSPPTAASTGRPRGCMSRYSQKR